MNSSVHAIKFLQIYEKDTTQKYLLSLKIEQKKYTVFQPRLKPHVMWKMKTLTPSGSTVPHSLYLRAPPPPPLFHPHNPHG